MKLKSLFQILAACTLAGSAHAQPTTTGTLKTAVPVPIVMNGKQVGSTTLPAGTKVTVVQESAGKTLIKAAVGETWVANDVLEVAAPEPVAAAPTPAPEAPATGGAVAPATQTTAEPVPTSAPVQNAKTVIVLLENKYPADMEECVAALKSKGYSVQTASQFKTLKRETSIRDGSGQDTVIPTGEPMAPDIMIPRKATTEAELVSIFGKPEIVIIADVKSISNPNDATKLAAKYLWKNSTEKVVGEIDAKKGPSLIDSYVAGGSTLPPCNVQAPKPFTITRYGRVTGFTATRPAVDKNYKTPTVDDVKAFGQTLAKSLAP